MKLFLVSLIVALCAISSVECGCNNERRTIKNSDAKNHVLCIQFKNSNCLHCKANGNYLKCDTQPALNSDPAANKGPAPDGLYAIGPVYTNPQHSKPWANLYPRKKAGKGWWDYYRGNPDVPGSRKYIGLHPGKVSWGCVTVTDRYNCWANLEKMLKSKRGDTITVSKTWWRTEKVNRIGILRAMN